MACNPGSPCFGGGIVIGPSVPINCGVVDLCATPRSITDLVSYNGPALTCSGINTCDSVTTALQKLDDKICTLISNAPLYTNDAAADSDTGLLSGSVYRINADARALRLKP